VRRQAKRDAAFHRLPVNFAAGTSSKAASRFACRRTPYFLADDSIARWLSRVLDLMRGCITPDVMKSVGRSYTAEQKAAEGTAALHDAGARFAMPLNTGEAFGVRLSFLALLVRSGRWTSS